MTLQELVAEALASAHRSRTTYPPPAADEMAVAAIRAVAEWLRTEAGDPEAVDAFASELVRVADLLDEQMTP